MNNELAELQAKLDHSQNEAHKAENEWNHIQTTAAGKTLLIGETRMFVYFIQTSFFNNHKLSICIILVLMLFRAIRNLYQLVLTHHKKENEMNVDVGTDHQLKKVS